MLANRWADWKRFVVQGVVVLALTAIGGNARASEPLKVGTFDLDATPPVGSPLAYDLMDRREASLRMKGLVLIGQGEPVVMVAVDWIGIGGQGHRRFREIIAAAVGTSPERVAVHCLHQHDAPRFDLGAEALLASEGLSGEMFNVAWSKETLRQAAQAAKQATADAKPATHIGLGSAKVNKVASNRRILGEDGKVKVTRWTATRDAAVRAYPEGVIDPLLKSISFYDGDRLLAVATYYATHPQSYYRTGTAHPDFPGMAREARQQALGVPHVHFNGAGGNIGAGKYNDGAHANRPVLAKRVEQGMTAALAAAKKHPVAADDLAWAVVSVSLPPAKHLDDAELLATLRNKDAKTSDRVSAAKALAFLRGCQSGAKTDVACLTLGKARVLHMPGELFVEYQLSAAALRPDLFVCTAAYGDYAPGYIGTEIGYSQGGYETSARASRVAPSVETILMDAVRKLLARD
ncbi:MAG: hypothetical protein N2C14_21025 [Planctomycetales bacterium]